MPTLQLQEEFRSRSGGSCGRIDYHRTVLVDELLAQSTNWLVTGSFSSLVFWFNPLV